MYLKRIVLNGFKSFADKTVLQLEENITAVVGPNGSGKSNIVDAIRWALGEQSARNLRGGKMEDVIFSGSANRRQLGRAEVSLLFDNSDEALELDYSEVEITRRITRSGISEYLINRDPCRLKDIQQLFMDTGLGQESYSIIGQGKVETLLERGPESRREIFEEAAGLVKYRSRKEETLNKLETTEGNLRRLDDLLSELKKRLKPLKKQAEKAIEYRKLEEELTSCRKQYYLSRYKTIESENSSLTAGLKELKKRQQERHQELRKRRQRIENIREELESLQLERETMKEQLHEYRRSRDRLGHRSDAAFQKRESLETEKKRLSATISELESERETIEKSIGEAKEQLSQLKSRAREAARLHSSRKKEAAQFEDQLKRAASEVAELREKERVLRDELALQREQVAEINGALQDKSRAASERRERSEVIADKLTRLKDELKRQEDLLDECDGEMKETAAGVRKLEKHGEKAGQELEQISRQLKKTERTYDQKKSRLASLEELKKSNQGYYAGVKAVLSEFGQQDAFYGSVADLIQVPKRLEKAVSVALGSRMQNIVVTTARWARQAVEYLKKTESGRATFLPLDNLEGGRNFKSRELEYLRGREGIVGAAVELISYPSEVQPAVCYLLGRVGVAEDLRSALSCRESAGFRLRLVTLDGEVVSPGGAISGGTVKERTFLLSRKRQIRTLRVEVKNVKEVLTELREASDRVKKSRDQLKEQIANQRGNLHKLELRKTDLTNQIDRIRGEIQHLQEEKERLASEDEKREGETEILAEKKADHRQQITGLEEQITDIQDKISAREKRTDELREKKSGFDEQVTELRMEKAGLSEKADNIQDVISAHRQKLEDIEKQVNECRGGQKELDGEIAETYEVIAEVNGRLKELEGKQAKCEDEIEKMDKRELQLKTEYAEEEKELAEVRSAADTIDSKTHRCEVKQARLKVKLDNLTEKMDEECGLKPDDIEERLPGTSMDPAEEEELSERIAALKGEIEQLGGVNLQALSEHKKECLRHSFLSEQRNDLTSARSDLFKIIDRLDRRMETLFRETFRKVQENFHDLFTRLFDGGKAELYLTDSSNLLETGVELFAQPPGKKLKKISLLSGGEKSLTAIALLFAILACRPSPIYVLDEIDAALDDANVDRFGRILNDFSRRAQFLIVTHQKRTMRRADTLYGVTMPESGVSQLLSIRPEDIRSQSVAVG